MKISKKEFLIRFLPVLLWALVIFAFSANPKPYNALPVSWSTPLEPSSKRVSTDEIIGRFLHVGEYIVLSVLVSRMVLWGNPIRKIHPPVIFGFSGLYALSDEFHQLFVPGRAFQLSDLLLDSIGIILGFLFILFIHWRMKNRSKS